MERHTFSQSDIDIVCSYIRVGASYKTALAAMADAAHRPWSKELQDAFLAAYEREMEAAAAQCEVLCLHNIMTEGGTNSSRYILERARGTAPLNTEAASGEWLL